MGELGRLAQGESASLTRKRSEVQILQRPPETAKVTDRFESSYPGKRPLISAGQ